MAERKVHQGYGPITLITAGADAAVGTARRLPTPMGRHTIAVDYSGTVTAAEIDLQGSLDGTLWFEIGTTTSTTDAMVHVTDKVVSHVRINLVDITGGGTATVKYVAQA